MFIRLLLVFLMAISLSADTDEKHTLQGATFRAIGNEPSWVLELFSDTKVLLHTNLGQNTIEFRVEEKHSNITSREYKMHSPHNTLFLRIEERRCFDSMSQNSYESTVYLNFDGHELRGCGKALY